MTTAPDVLVVGAGPTGLTLALQAHEHGARVRVVERRPEPFRPSRAMVMHPRTLTPQQEGCRAARHIMRAALESLRGGAEARARAAS